MQITNVSAYSLKQVLKLNSRGDKVAGYTVRPGFSNGLFVSALLAIIDRNNARRVSGYIGF